MVSEAVGGSCAKFWASMGCVMDGLSSLSSVMPRNADDLGHGNGVDDDIMQGQTGAQETASAATDAGGDASSDQVSGTCPLCKVAIVIGHNSVAQGADSAGVPEYVYNTDIADRTLKKIEALGEGKITAQIFLRTRGSGEIRRVYTQVNAFLEGVPSNKKISIELHYNSAVATSARRAETLYKGDIGFAQRTATAMAAIFGGGGKARHYTTNERGKATFLNGPSNTYLMEPFFGSNPASRDIALTDSGKDQLADVYARELVAWVG